MMVAGMATLLAPIAWWQYGPVGIGIISIFAGAMLASLWISAKCAAALFRAGQSTAGLLVGSAVRMLVPLALALVLAIQRDQYLPLRSVVYMVPLYLTMLLADTHFQWRECLGGKSRATSVFPSLVSVRGKRG